MSDITILQPGTQQNILENNQPDIFDTTEIPPNIYGMDVNYAAANSWYAYLPIENILGKSYNSLNLHLTRFSLPSMETMSTTVSYKGYSKEIPVKVINASTKQLTLEYIVDQNWNNYTSLFAWISHIYGTLNPMMQNDDTNSINPSDYLPLRIYLLDNYKRKCREFIFNNTWIKLFNDLSLDQTTSETINHSFTLVYDDYQIVKL